MTKFIWLASYPRSGNTWLRFLLADLLYGPVQSSDQVASRIPDIEWGIRAEHLHGRPRTMIKTHWKYHCELPLREDTVGAIYIVRNPLDVMVSALNHARLNSRGFRVTMSEKEVQERSRRWITNYIARAGTKDWIRLGFGTWEENLESWSSSSLPFPRFMLRYEDLHRDTAPVLERLCGFLGLAPDPGRISGAMHRCSFAAMRAMEEREMREERGGTFFLAARRAAHGKGLRFVNRGQVDSAGSVLTPEQRQAAILRFGPAMKRMECIDWRAQPIPATSADPDRHETRI